MLYFSARMATAAIAISPYIFLYPPKTNHMAEVINRIYASYTPKTDDQTITVSVQIGDGRSGSCLIYLGTDLLSNTTTATLGTKADLSGKKTSITVTISDVLLETNRTSITVLFKEGGITTTFGPYTKQILNEADTMIYRLKVNHP